VTYNATSNELVRTNTLVKGAVVQIDATPFKQWYEQHYRVVPGAALQKKKTEEAPAAAATPAAGAAVKVPVAEGKKISHSLKHKLAQRIRERVLDPQLDEQFKTGRLYARLTSRPGQSGRADGYILEGEELAFYVRKIAERKKKGGAK
jgi:small subunit ribosomal protein S8e